MNSLILVHYSVPLCRTNVAARYAIAYHHVERFTVCRILYDPLFQCQGSGWTKSSLSPLQHTHTHTLIQAFPTHTVHDSHLLLTRREALFCCNVCWAPSLSVHIHSQYTQPPPSSPFQTHRAPLHTLSTTLTCC